MITEQVDPVCEHEWDEYDDPAVYKDGLNCPSIAICNKCGKQQDIRLKYAGSNSLKWYENLFLVPFTIVVILYLITFGPVLIIAGWIKDAFFSKKAV